MFRAECRFTRGDRRGLVACCIFLKRDLKTYLYQSHFIFDLSALKEQGDEFVNLRAGIYYQKSDANIVIYADNCYPGDEILDKLVHNEYRCKSPCIVFCILHQLLFDYIVSPGS